MFFPLFNKKNKKSLKAVIDIGSSSVGVALLQERIKKNAKKGEIDIPIVFAARESFSFDKQANFKRFLAVLGEAMDKVLLKAARAGFGLPDTVFCFLPSVFYVSQTKILKYHSGQDFIFTKNLLDQMCKGEVESFSSSNQIARAEVLDSSMEIIENQVMEISLNGYPIVVPFGKKAKTAQVAQYLSGGSKQVLDCLRQMIYKGFPQSKIIFHTFPYGVFRALKHISGGKKEFVGVDVSGELTDVLTVSKGVLSETMTFPFGRSTLSDKVAQKLNTIKSEADSVLRLYAENKLEIKTKQRLENILEPISQEWLDMFKQALSRISDNSILPETFIVMTSDQVGLVFLSWLKKDGFQKYTTSVNPFTFHYLEDEVRDYHDSTVTTHDSFLLLESLFVVQ